MRWDAHLVRLYHEEKLLAVYPRQEPGTFARRPGGPPAEAPDAQRAYVERLLGRCERVGPELRLWGEQALQERGVRAIPLIQGVVNLTRSHPRERLLHAARLATEHRLFRFQDIQRLVANGASSAPLPRLIEDHPAIRPMTHYRLEEFS